MSDRVRCVRMQVGDARLEDVAEGRARLSHSVFAALQLREGDIVRITGARDILAAAFHARSEDDGLDVIRLDGTQRRRLSVDVGGAVDVRKHELKAAERIQLVALGDSRRFDLSPEDLRTVLGNGPLMVGDTIEAAPREKAFQAQVSILGLNIAGVEGTSTECGSVLLRIASTSPSGVVRVGPTTTIELVSADQEIERRPELA